MERAVLTPEDRARILVACPRAVLVSDPEGELPDVVLRRPTADEMRKFSRVHEARLAGRDELPPEEEDAFQAEQLQRNLDSFKLFPDTSAAELLRVWPELEVPLTDALLELFSRTVRRYPKAPL